jgi:hypothetical protein
MPSDEILTPVGLVNRALVPMPLLIPDAPLTSPANRDTAEVDRTILRIMLLLASATRAKLPSEETVTIRGELNVALEPKPLLLPYPLLTSPANKETAEVERTILRIMWFLLSATRAKLPSEEILTPVGKKKLAMVPMPLLLPYARLLSPAINETEEVDRMIFRTISFQVSAIRAKLPSEETLTPAGWFQCHCCFQMSHHLRTKRQLRSRGRSCGSCGDLSQRPERSCHLTIHSLHREDKNVRWSRCHCSI